MMAELREQKTELRTQYMEKRRMIPENERAEKNAAICRAILTGATYRFADVLLLYYPRPDEIDLLPIAETAIAAGKKVAFPRCRPEDRSMDFYLVDSLDGFQPGPYDIMEPTKTLGIYTFAKEKRENCVCFVPAVVYDKKGYRIGYGGGYYDRYLSSFGGTVIGVAYRDFIIGSVPHGRFDLAVDVLFSEGGIYVKSR